MCRCLADALTEWQCVKLKPKAASEEGGIWLEFVPVAAGLLVFLFG